MIKTLRLTKSTEGFTLTELLVTIALIVLITMIALPSISSSLKISLNSAAREIATIAKETYNSTIMTGRVHRIVYDLEEDEYWVEVGPLTHLLDTPESKEIEERRKRFNTPEDEEPPSQFVQEKLITRKKRSLPRGVEFTDVFGDMEPDAITAGKAYTHFFPHGLVEQTLIHIKDNSDHQASLVIGALGGNTRVRDGYLNREEAYGLEE